MSHSQLTHLVMYNVTTRIEWGVSVGSACTQPMRCTYAAIHHRIELIAACMWDVRYAYATGAVYTYTQWSGSRRRHHTQWLCPSCSMCAACASPMRHWYVVDTQHMRNSSAGDVPPNHLGDLTEYWFIFSYTEGSGITRQWNRAIS